MTKYEATSIGEEMRKKLGEGWTLRLHENLGWHCTAYNESGHLAVSFSEVGGIIVYCCLLTDDPEKSKGTGCVTWSMTGTKLYHDPVEAVLAQVKYARSILEKLTTAVMYAELTTSKFACKCCGKPLN